MKALKFFLVNLTTWSLIFSPSIFAKVDNSSTENIQFITHYNKLNLTTLGSLVKYTESFDIKTADKMKAYIQKNNLALDAILPSLQLGKNFLYMSYKGNKVILTPTDDKKIQINYLNKKIMISPEMKMEEIESAFSKLIGQAKTFSFTSLLIEDANAGLLEVAQFSAVAIPAIVVALVALAGAWSINSGQAYRDQQKRLKKACQEIVDSGKSITNADVAYASQTKNWIEKNFGNECNKVTNKNIDSEKCALYESSIHCFNDIMSKSTAIKDESAREIKSRPNEGTSGNQVEAVKEK